MNESTNLNSRVIELHYFLKDDSHSMDAFIFNECEREFLNIVRDVARQLGVKIEVRTEALGKGGICCFFMVISLETLVMYIETIALVLTALSSVIDIIDKVRSWIQESKTQKKPTESESEPYKHVIHKEDIYQYIDKKILRSRSNFYANLFLCDAVEGLTIRTTDENGAECLPEKRIAKDDFKEFIMSDNEVVPEYVNDAEIKIIPPIDIEGCHKWFGKYKDEPIRFDMRSNDFKNAVQSGQIPIKDNTFIKCHLKVRRRIDKEYKVVPKGYEVMDVVDFWY